MNVRDSWSTCSTVSGRIAVILFFLYIYSALAGLAYGYIWPAHVFNQCRMVFGKLETFLITTLVRELYLFIFAFLMFIQWQGLQATNMTFVLVLVTSWAVYLDGGFQTRGKIYDLDPDRISEDCFKHLSIVYGFFAGIPWLILVFKAIDHMQQKSRGESDERQQLLA
jgi:Na+/proline symporter